MNFSKSAFRIMAMTMVAISCNDHDIPAIENEEEIISEVNLIFRSTEGDVVMAIAKDPDGEGFANIEVIDTIRLVANTEYLLSIELKNELAESDITQEVKAEGVEHQFFFEFTTDLFLNPQGLGNVISGGTVNYEDSDVNNLPIGLDTKWITGSTSNGFFRVVLKHQPGIKSALSTAKEGESDIDLEWIIQIYD